MREILVRDLAQCIDCQTCITACAHRHGRARMTMDGPHWGHYQLPAVCRHCPDPPCLQACPWDQMQQQHGQTFVAESCRGCRKCVAACPHGVIQLLPRQVMGEQNIFDTLLGAAPRAANQASAYSIATDATRCVQCGICVFHCPVGIPVREYAREGRTVEDSRCVGCGLCIAKCPRGTLRFETYPTMPVSKYRADKCDLCRGYSGSACVEECPTGALQRLPADGGLIRLNSALGEAVVQPPIPAAEPWTVGELARSPLDSLPVSRSRLMSE